MSLLEISKRYTGLATSGCCLSCGGAGNFAAAQPDEVCVDLGSGRGTDAIRLAEAVGNGGFVYGVDIADGMIAKAAKTAATLGVSNVNFINSPLDEIKLNDRTADLVISNCSINQINRQSGMKYTGY
jgi:arsenite methyltransferase